MRTAATASRPANSAGGERPKTASALAAIVGGIAANADAVFGLSPPAEFAGLDAVAAVRTYDRPLLVAAGALEPDFPDEARRIVEASPATDKSLELPRTGFHGTDILTDRAAAGLRAKLVAFVRG